MHSFFSPRRFFIVLSSLAIAGFILFLSVWRLNLSSVVGQDDRSYTAQVSASERLRQLFTPPILSDHPLYVLGMISDRLDLYLANPEERLALKLQYADTRLATAQLLLKKGRVGLAITAATKAEKYIISAAEEIPILSIPKQKDANALLLSKIKTHQAVLVTMKPAFNGAQQATLDRLIEQILILTPDR